MRILIIGGTRFVGRAMAEAAIVAGHDVTLLHRQATEALPYASHLLADRNGELSVLGDDRWDATIDVCAYVPRQVRALHEALGDRGGHHVFVSTVSVYGDVDHPRADEDAPLATEPAPEVEEVTGETYGGLKVACERAAAEAYGSDRLTVVRPTYVVGPHDHTGRFPWWVLRAARGGPMIAPGPDDAPFQTVDARDMGAWVVRLAEDRTAGVFTAARPATTFGQMLREVVLALGSDTTLVPVDADTLTAAGIDGMQLPMWSEGSGENALAMSVIRAETAGLTHRSFAETVRDTYAWAQDAGGVAVLNDQFGLSAEREAEILAED